MGRILLALSLLIGLSGCATTGKFFKGYSEAMKNTAPQANAYNADIQPNRSAYCTSDIIGNSVYTNCY